MRAYGYPRDTVANGESPIQLREIAIEADEACLEALSAFAQAALAEMRTLGKRFDHVHFQTHAKHGAMPGRTSCSPPLTVALL